MATLASSTDIAELCRAYRDARAQIEQFTDHTERDIGRAALRLEATHAYRQMSTTGTGASPADLKELGDYIANLEGGERIEARVQAFDARAQQAAQAVLTSAVKSLAQGTLVGALAVAAGVVAWIIAAGLDAGTALAFAFAAGTVSGGVLLYAVRGGAAAAEALGGAITEIWSDASSVGVASDAALRDARTIEQRLVPHVTGAPWSPARFTATARTRAMFLAGTTLALLAVAALLFVGAVATGFSNASAESLTPTYDPYQPAP